MQEIELESEDLQAALKELRQYADVTEADVFYMAGILDERRIRLPVVDDEDKLAGIISRADIVRAMGKQ